MKRLLILFVLILSLLLVSCSALGLDSIFRNDSDINTESDASDIKDEDSNLDTDDSKVEDEESDLDTETDSDKASDTKDEDSDQNEEATSPKIMYVSNSLKLNYDGSIDTTKPTTLFTVLRSIGYDVSTQDMHKTTEGLTFKGYDLYIFEGVEPPVKGDFPTDGAVWMFNPPSIPRDDDGKTAVPVEILADESFEGNDEMRLAPSSFGSAYSAITKDISSDIAVGVGKYNPMVVSSSLRSIFVYSNNQPAMVAGAYGGVRMVVTGFAFNDSSWPMKITDYVILFRNLINYSIPDKPTQGGTLQPIVDETEKEVNDAFGDMKESLEQSKESISEDVYEDIKSIIEEAEKELFDMLENGASDMEIVAKLEDTKDQLEYIMLSEQDTSKENADAAKAAMDRLDQAQDIIMGVEPSEKPDQEQQPSTDTDTDTDTDTNTDTDTGTDTDEDLKEDNSSVLDEEVYIEGEGMVSLEELLDRGYLEEDLNKMYQRGELTEEQYKAIEAYFAQLDNNES